VRVLVFKGKIEIRGLIPTQVIDVRAEPVARRQKNRP